MLVNLKSIMDYAEEMKIGIGAFNVPNLESLKAIVAAAQECDTPVILNYAPVHSCFMDIEEAAFLMLHYAKKATVPICVHLDHGASFEICMKAIRLGFTSVMIDASGKSLEDNIKETRAVVRAAHSVGVSVEAELGHIFSSEIGIAENDSATEVETRESFKDLNDVYTNPKVAKEFVEATQVDALAIAFGTSHGVYLTKPELDLNRISEIKAEIDMPFVMHGGSGLSKEEFQKAVINGVRKINYYTYMSLCGGKAIKEFVDSKKDDELVFFHDIPNVAIAAMKENIIEAIKIFSLKK
jgi:fructose-bisphosphate aldolase class II